MIDSRDAISQPTLIADYACETGENPLWHPIERRLYWTDNPSGEMARSEIAPKIPVVPQKTCPGGLSTDERKGRLYGLDLDGSF